MFTYDIHKKGNYAAQSVNVSAQTDTDDTFIEWSGAIGVKGHTRVMQTGRCSAEVWGDIIATPVITILVTICVTRNEEATVE